MNIFESGEYLTEDKLYLVLCELFGVKLVERQHKLGKYKVDFLVANKLIIEFDGYRHFSTSKVIYRDLEVARLAKKKGLDFMSVPYFIQYEYVCRALGFKNKNFGFKYPNGFIDKKALRPRDFNLRGLIIFALILHSFDEKVRLEILKTLDIEDTEAYNYGLLKITGGS